MPRPRAWATVALPGRDLRVKFKQSAGEAEPGFLRKLAARLLEYAAETEAWEQGKVEADEADSSA